VKNKKLNSSLPSPRTALSIMLGTFLVIYLFVASASLIFLRQKTMFYYDEIFDLVPMTYVKSGCESFQSEMSTRINIYCWPILNGILYQGPLRAYVLLPLILLGKLTPATLTTVSIILLFFCGLCIFKASRMLGHTKWNSALITLVFFSLPAVWTNILFDLGPVSTQLLLRGLLLLSILKNLQKNQLASKTTVLLSCLLLWGKLDGVWFVSSGLISIFIILSFSNGKIMFPKKIVDFLYFLVTFLGLLASILVSKIQGVTIDRIDFIGKIRYQFPNNFSVGTLPIMFDADFSQLRIVGQIVFYVFLISSILAILKIKTPYNLSLVEKFTLFTSLQTLLMLFYLVVTPRATAPWHSVSIFPSALFPFLFLLTTTHRSGKIIQKSLKLIKFDLQISHFRRIILLIFVGTLLCINTYVMSTIHHSNPRALSSPILMSKLIEISNLASHDEAVVFASWGLYNSTVVNPQLVHDKKRHIYDVWPWYGAEQTESLAKSHIWNYQNGPLRQYSRYVFVGLNHVPGNSGLALESHIRAAELCVTSYDNYQIGDSDSALSVIRAVKCD
jgi:hypothetical protein